MDTAIFSEDPYLKDSYLEDPNWRLEDGQITAQEAEELRELAAMPEEPSPALMRVRAQLEQDSAKARSQSLWSVQWHLDPWFFTCNGDSTVRKGSAVWKGSLWEFGVGSWEEHWGTWMSRRSQSWNMKMAAGLADTLGLLSLGTATIQGGIIATPQHGLGFATWGKNNFQMDLFASRPTPGALLNIQGNTKLTSFWSTQQQFFWNHLDTTEHLVPLTKLQRQSLWIYTSSLLRKIPQQQLRFEERWQVARTKEWQGRTRVSWKLSTPTGNTTIAATLSSSHDSLQNMRFETQAERNLLPSPWSGIGSGQWRWSPESTHKLPRLQSGVAYQHKNIWQMKFLTVVPSPCESKQAVSMRFQAQGNLSKKSTLQVRWTLHPWGYKDNRYPQLIHLTLQLRMQIE